MAKQKKGSGKKTTLGPDENLEGALAYLLGPLTGILFLLLEKNDFVKFHAKQSTVTFIILYALWWVCALTVVLFWAVWLIQLLGFIAWLLGMYKAYSGERYKFPFIGDFINSL